ncbi:hypothetical protein R54767_01683 [Paraburkholderia gardini]|uniref:Uncharacterized protein n=1 Tax=Paraburkholderia gardini TaxID=2823469 RepID=A0ABN7QJF1_9BURK|nr:hypothetical protein R54767_01683 [Paraburkholderia gardini]
MRHLPVSDDNRGAQSSRAGGPPGGRRPGALRVHGLSKTALFYCGAGRPWIFMPGLMPFSVNQPLLISSTYTPLFFGQ